jgi:hypothetical protein
MTTVYAAPEGSPARLIARLALVVAVGIALLTPSTRAQGTKGVSLQPGQHGPRLAIEVNGKTLAEWTVTSIPDTVEITVTPQDSLGNAIPLVGYEIQVWDPHVMELVGSTIGASSAVSKLVPHNRGQTTIQIRGSGVRTWVLVELGPSTLGIGPRGAPLAQGGQSNNILVAGGRLSYAGYNYSFAPFKSTFSGTGGVVAEAYIGRTYNYGLTLVLGAGFGVLKADSLGASTTAKELELYLRGDYAFMAESRVRPVVSLGTGLYRIRTGSNSPLWNSAIFWVASGGVDYTLTPRAVGELRLSTQQLYETFSQLKWNGGQSANGYVGNLLVIGAGVRFTL